MERRRAFCQASIFAGPLAAAHASVALGTATIAWFETASRCWTVRPIGAFRFVTFRLIWCSSLASAGAQWIERIATSWLALQTSGGPLGVGVVLAARMLPSLLLGIAVGAVADRADRRRVLMMVALSGAIFAVALGALVRLGSIAFWQVVLFSFLGGCIQVSDTPARQALVVDSVDRAAGHNAIALNAVASRLFGAVGAFVGGIIIPTFGVASCYGVVATSYLVGLLLLARADPRAAKPVTPIVHPPFRRAVADAGRLILTHRAVRTLVLAAVACEIFGFSYMTVVPTFAQDVLRAGAEGYGAMSAASAIGATLAVLIIASLPGTIRREPLLAAVYLVYGLALLALASTPNLTTALLAMLVIGACASAFDTFQQTLIQFAVPDDQRGRAVGIWVFSIGTAPVGHLEVGVLAATVGAPAALLVNGALVVLGAVTLAVQAPVYRWQRVLHVHERLSAFAEPHSAPDKGNSGVTPEPPP